MSYVGNVKKGTATHLVGSTLYGTCGTASGTVAKVGTLSNFDALLTGVTVHLKMTNSNTASAPTLNVNGTGAKPIVRYGTTAVGTTATTSWYAGSVVSFTYDGTSWVVNDYKENTNTTYTAGTNIQINGTTISATDKTFQNDDIFGINASGTIASGGNVTDVKSDLYTYTGTRYNDLFVGTLEIAFDANATGTRFFATSLTEASSTTPSRVDSVRIKAADNGKTVMTIPLTAQLYPGKKIGIQLWQNSGATLGWTVSMVGRLLYSG